MHAREARPEEMNQTLKIAHAAKQTLKKLESRESERQERKRDYSFVAKRIESNLELSL